MGRNTCRKDLDSVGVVLGSGGWKVIRLHFIHLEHAARISYSDSGTKILES
jgi:hypothetical protein